MKTLQQHAIALVIDTLYHNASRVKIDQRNITDLAKTCDVPYTSFTKIRNILIRRKLLVTDGHGRSSSTSWNRNRVGPNETLTRSVFTEYHADINKTIRLENKVSSKMSIEKAVSYLIKQGYSGELSKSYIVNNVTHKETLTFWNQITHSQTRVCYFFQKTKACNHFVGATT